MEMTVEFNVSAEGMKDNDEARGIRVFVSISRTWENSFTDTFKDYVE